MIFCLIQPQRFHEASRRLSRFNTELACKVPFADRHAISQRGHVQVVFRVLPIPMIKSRKRWFASIWACNPAKNCDCPPGRRK